MLGNPKCIKLYRGDYEEIDEFDFRKTKKSCLVGQGIYLTNREAVADTYRVKGARVDERLMPIEVLFEGEAKDRPEAIEKGFRMFSILHERRLAYNGLKLKEKQRKEKELREAYELAKEQGRIKAEYLNGNPRFARTLRVTYDTQVIIGQIAVFQFPEKEFTDSMLPIFEVNDPDILGMFFDAGIAYGTPYEDRDSYIRHNRYARRIEYTKRIDFAGVRRLVEPFGYRGFEYPGGMMVGGHGRHRAFCVWHDDWVNEHLVTVKR